MKKFLFTLILCLFTLPALAQKTILVVGDSLSSGYGIDIKQGWVSLLQKRLLERNYDYTVVNSSISGDTTSNGLNRLPALLDKHKPDVTILEFGGNDALRGLQLFIIKKNLQKMIDLIKKADSKVLLVGFRLPPNYGPQYIEQFQELYAQLAEKNEIGFIPLFLKGVDDNPKLMQSDGIHPKEQAQVTLLDNVWPELVKLLSNN
jgi:acyl-CoA thioesterase-1